MADDEVDRALVERAQQGDQRAFGLLVEKYQRRLARLLSRLIRDPVEVEDVAQETFIRAYRALPGFRGESAFYTWLYRIGINTAKNHLASMKRRPASAADVQADDSEALPDADRLRETSTPESLALSREIGAAVGAAMDELPEDLRTALQLREVEGLSYEEIAGLMGCPIGTVRSRIFRARDAIAERLRPLLDTAADRRW